MLLRVGWLMAGVTGFPGHLPHMLRQLAVLLLSPGLGELARAIIFDDKGQPGLSSETRPSMIRIHGPLRTADAQLGTVVQGESVPATVGSVRFTDSYCHLHCPLIPETPWVTITAPRWSVESSPPSFTPKKTQDLSLLALST